MARYNFDKGISSQKKTVHPVWRGIGCLMMLIIPVLSYVASAVLIDFGLSQRWWFIPRALLGHPQFPSIFYRYTITANIFGWIASINNLYANLLFGAVIAALLFGLMAAVYGMAYSTSAPSRYGPYDVPPPQYKSKKKSR